MKRNFEGFQVDGQLGENWHDNGNTFVQSLVRQFGATPPTGTAKDGRNRTFDMLMGTNFADGKGNVTAYLSYRHADPVESSQRDFGACQMSPTNDPAGNVTGITCGGSANSNWFQPTAGPNAGNAYSVFGHSFVPTVGRDDSAGELQLPALHLHDPRRRSLQRGLDGARADH